MPRRTSADDTPTAPIGARRAVTAGAPLVLAGAGLIGLGAVGLVLTLVGGGLWLANRPPHGNQAACLAYVRTFNEAPCMVIELDGSAICPAALDRAPCDLAPYYGCMAEAIRCEGDLLDISRQATCATSPCP